MAFNFVKMHGLGNDYVYVDVFAESLPDDIPALAQRVSDRHFGVGSDGLILIGPGESARVRMRMFNADGSESEMCGNGLRCTVKYACEHGLFGDGLTEPAERFASAIAAAGLTSGVWRSGNVQTGAGVLTVAMHIDADKRVDCVAVDMGLPRLKPAEIPVVGEGDAVVRRVIEADGEPFCMTCVSMGNPHAVIFVDCVDAVELQRFGPILEHHRVFPRRANIHFVQAISTSQVRAVTWERGTGPTLACGTGACAIAVAGVLEGRLDRSNQALAVDLPGGRLTIGWRPTDDHVIMLGPATTVFEGRWLER